ncbi:MAG TPA: restriction endonuclease [Ktedonobacteraceae bacterium]|nr:restriction endonuclease [Ktedonobacteraceae bacterium]
MQDYETFENIVANLHQALYPEASITWNKKIMGKSGIERQIDVFIESYSGIYPIKIVVDCKHYASKVDIKDIESTWMLVNDVRANLGVIICNSGYTEGAIKRAKDIGLLKLCLAIDSLHEKFSAKLTLPVLAQNCELRYTVETYPKTLVPIMRKSGSEGIFLENLKTLKKVSLYEFVLDHIKADTNILSTNNVIEILEKDYYLYIHNKRKRYSKIIIIYSFAKNLVIGYAPMKTGKGIVEVLENERGYATVKYLNGTEISIEYDIEELKYWKWRDVDPEKDCLALLMKDFESMQTLLKVKEDFI